MTYQEKLKDPRWQEKRLEILNRDNNICQKCGDSGTEAHHLKYIDGFDPWDYDNDDLQSLCPDCHETESSFVIWTKYERMKRKLSNHCPDPKTYEDGIFRITYLLGI